MTKGIDVPRNAFRNLSFLNYRFRAEEAAAGLPGLVAAAERAAASVLSGAHTQRKPGMGEKFWQYREYDPSDRPQDIDWRQSARGDRLFVREKEWETTQTALFWCQRNESMDFRSDQKLPSKQDAAMILTLALSILLSRAGEQVAPLEGSGLPGRSELALLKLGEQLLDHRTADMPGKGLRTIPKRSSLVVVGDFLAPVEELTAAFDVLAAPAENAMLVQVLDPAELTLPYDGRVIFTRGGKDARHHVENVESIRAAYHERLRAQMDAIRNYCRKHRWHWLLHSTDADPRQTLFDAWTMMTPENFHRGRA